MQHTTSRSFISARSPGFYHALGIDWKKEYMRPIGQPVKISNSLDERTGSPVKELLV